MKRFFYLILSSIMTVTILLSSMTVHAEDVKSMIVLLGDSITTGYGLSDDQLKYGDYLENYYNADVKNYAENGLTTEGLIEKLNDDDIVAAVKNADMICFSIGGNDIMNAFEQALSDSNIKDYFFGKDKDDMNISINAINDFTDNYSSELNKISDKAGDNLNTIQKKLYQINPDAKIIAQTIYNPLESSKNNIILSELKKFADTYICNINDAIKKNFTNTADIHLKFSSRPYLYTNIDSVDIHPNYIGHLLIAEEIIQILGDKGNTQFFKSQIDNITHGVYSEFPQYISIELDDFINGNLRSSSLEDVIQNTDTSANNNINLKEVKNEAVQADSDKKKTNKTNNMLSKIFMIAGVALIMTATVIKFIKSRRNK